MAARAPEIVHWPAASRDQQEVARRAAAVLRAGDLIVYPTDTVYGLGADPLNAAAIQRIYEVKRRPDEKAIVWLAASTEDIRAWCKVDRRAEALAARFWPGALTLVLRRLRGPEGELPTLGVRVPAHPAALAIIRAAGSAVATTSANRSGEPSPRTAGEALQQIGDGVALVIDAGPAPGGIESTVIDLTVDPPRLLRRGAISAEEIKSTLGVAIAEPSGEVSLRERG